MHQAQDKGGKSDREEEEEKWGLRERWKSALSLFLRLSESASLVMPIVSDHRDFDLYSPSVV